MTTARASAELASRAPGSKFLRKLKDNYPFLIMLFPAVLIVFLFNYLPIYGVLIAFQDDFVPGDPFLQPVNGWVGFKNFTDFFNSDVCILMLNATRGKRTAKILQTIFNGPHFISLVVLIGMLSIFFGQYGLVNNIKEGLGGTRTSFFQMESAFRPMYILSSNWQDFGWSAIIYIAALSNVDPGQHEAAILDGTWTCRPSCPWSA